jgi:hypothetical protein
VTGRPDKGHHKSAGADPGQAQRLAYTGDDAGNQRAGGSE